MNTEYGFHEGASSPSGSRLEGQQEYPATAAHEGRGDDRPLAPVVGKMSCMSLQGRVWVIEKLSSRLLKSLGREYIMCCL